MKLTKVKVKSMSLTSMLCSLTTYWQVFCLRRNGLSRDSRSSRSIRRLYQQRSNRWGNRPARAGHRHRPSNDRSKSRHQPSSTWCCKDPAVNSVPLLFKKKKKNFNWCENAIVYELIVLKETYQRRRWGRRGRRWRPSWLTKVGC